MLGNPKITFSKFLELESLLRRFTASEQTYVDFWFNFFNPYNLPDLNRADLEKSLELLARGSYTQESTLISKTFARRVYEDWVNKGCQVKGDADAIDSFLLKKKMQSGEVHIDTLTQCLRIDSEYGVNGDNRPAEEDEY